ncbi:LacI family transcriptional regulator [Pararhizobium sp.]|uniref:LacI family transcriptional regulator n=1 Tax=Pararhizobium sp. TaxID=1977563 RepID=UPI00271AD207|nr:LacI family transcriptional regulator [Pararhizobium sp.]MDO9415353.1 LacI family transcriptional regulator [Pararhizobium sp.]
MSMNDDNLPSEDTPPTLKTIAFMTGLSIATVSRALQDNESVHAETRARVQLVAAQVGYVANRAGVRLRTGTTNTIALLIDPENQFNMFASDMVYGAMKFLAGTRYSLAVTPYQRNSDPLEAVRHTVESGAADGIILSRIEPSDPRVAYLIQKDFPFATHGRTAMGVEHAYYDFDNAAYAMLAVERLRQKGRKRISLFAPPESQTYHYHINDGFFSALLKYGGANTPFIDAVIDDSIDDIRRKTHTAMSMAERPDGIVSAAGDQSIAVIAGIRDAGLRLGIDVDIITKQAWPLMHMAMPELHTIKEDVKKAGGELARAVLGIIAGQDPRLFRTLEVPTGFVADQGDQALEMQRSF